MLIEYSRYESYEWRDQQEFGASYLTWFLYHVIINLHNTEVSIQMSFVTVAGIVAVGIMILTLNFKTP